MARDQTDFSIRDAVANLPDAVRAVIVGTTTLTAFLLVVLGISGNSPTGGGTIAIAFGAAIVMLAGLLFLSFVGIRAPEIHLPLAMVTGAAIIALVLAVACYVSDIRAGTAFLGASALAVAGVFVSRRRGGIAAPPLRIGHVFAAAAIGAVAILWCRLSAGAAPHLAATGVARIWSDYFIHGTVIAQFGSAIGAERLSYSLVDQPLPFYHYASFMLPAAVMQTNGMTAFAAATGVLLPLGLFLMLLGIYALGTAVSNQIGGLAAVAALVFIPDPSTYWVENGFFGFDWLTFTAPGGGYAIGTAAAMLAMTKLAPVRISRVWIAILLVLLLAVFEFRVHIFVLFVPAAALTLLWSTPFGRRYRIQLAVGTAVVLAVAASALTLLPSLRAIWLHNSGVGTFLPASFSTSNLGAHPWNASPSAVSSFLLLAPAILGWFIVAYPLTLAFAFARRRATAFDLFPAWCLFAYLAIVLFAPLSSFGEPEEWRHRPFVLLYAVFVCWTAALIARGVDLDRKSPVIPAALFAVLGILWAVLSWNKDPARPLMSWGRDFYDVAVPAGVLGIGAYLHDHAAAGDVLAYSPMDPGARLNDTPTELGALSNVPLYIARPVIQSRDVNRGAIVSVRLAELAAAARIDDAAQLRETLRKLGITWYAIKGVSPPFDPGGKHAVYSKGGFLLYHFGRTGLLASDDGVPPK